MGNITLQTIEKNGVAFNFIPTDKYKTITVVAKFKAPLRRETVTKRALLPFVLQRGTERYPSEQALQTKLDELYGALLHITTTKKGMNDIIHVEMEFANEKFIPGAKDNTKHALQLFHDIMFAPLIKNGHFNDQIVTREKRQLENKINAVFDDKIVYANQRLIDEMFKGEPYALHTDGYVDDLPQINGVSLAQYYQEMLTNDVLDIYVLGDFDLATMEEQMTSLFKRQEAQQVTPPIKDEASMNSKETQKIVESTAIQQAKLHIGYRTNILYKDDDYTALQVFNGLFGAFPNSKLFLNVREKHSLAYYISSAIESHIGLMLVYSGVEVSEYERTYDIISEQLEALRAGDFTEADLNTVQDLIVSNIREGLDHPNGTIEILYQQVVGEKARTPKAFIEQIKRVTKEEVIAVANKIKLDTVYVLTGKEGEQD